MTNIDQFESVFKSADKAQFELESIELEHFLYVTDVDAERSQAFRERIGGYLDVLCDHNQQRVTVLNQHDYESVEQLINQIAELGPDLVITYRNLHMPSGEHPFSLGVYLDVLTQATRLPILVFPDPASDWEPVERPMSTVMAITDHLTGDRHLVSIAARCTRPGGTLWLTHVEDQAIFDHYLRVISKIPELDTDIATEKIAQQLLKEPKDYIRSCREHLRGTPLDLEIREDVIMGHQLSDHCRLVTEHGAQLLVMNSKDDDQLAMHGLAYPLTVELDQLPLLLL